MLERAGMQMPFLREFPLTLTKKITSISNTSFIKAAHSTSILRTNQKSIIWFFARVTSTPSSSITKSMQKQWMRKKEEQPCPSPEALDCIPPHIVKQPPRAFARRMANLGSSSIHQHRQTLIKMFWTKRLLRTPRQSLVLEKKKLFINIYNCWVSFIMPLLTSLHVFDSQGYQLTSHVPLALYLLIYISSQLVTYLDQTHQQAPGKPLGGQYNKWSLFSPRGMIWSRSMKNFLIHWNDMMRHLSAQSYPKQNRAIPTVGYWMNLEKSTH